MLNMVSDLFETPIIENRIAPFFHITSEESVEMIEDRMLALKDMGIRAVTLEYVSANRATSRTPFDSAWLATLDRVVSVCKKLGMTFWIQDAAPFPTGYADGELEKPEYRELNKQYINEKHINVSGPLQGAAFKIGELERTMDIRELIARNIPDTSQRKPICTIAYRRHADGGLDKNSAVSLDDRIDNGLLVWDVPPGDWAIYHVYSSYDGGGRKHYINLLDCRSVQLQITTVHQPMYEHLQDELGKTWCGFFFDEPEIGNAPGYDFYMLPGSKNRAQGDTSPLPWCNEMPGLLDETAVDWKRRLPLLWYEAEAASAAIRFIYMDCVTRLVCENYSMQVSGWCRQRGIGYIGHVLEDEGSHARLGCGPGHYFRIQRGQDMAGVDIISGQLMPGCDKYVSWYGTPDGDGAFYHYGIAKLASSAAHIDPLKNNQSVCEIFALYGGTGGPRLRKFIIDHLLVNGVNNLVPAESVVDGIPPAYFRQLYDYTNRMCSLVSKARPVIKVAILYHAEAEWSGPFQPFHLPAAELARHQISYDVIPADVFDDPAYYQTETSSGLSVNGHAYEALIIPYCQYLPQAAADLITQTSKNGFPVFFVDGLPDAVCGTLKPLDFKGMDAQSLQGLADAVKEVINADLIVDRLLPDLRYAHFRLDEADYYLLHNEASKGRQEFAVELDMAGPIYQLDVMEGKVYALAHKLLSNGHAQIEVSLREWECMLLCSGKTEYDGTAIQQVFTRETHSHTQPWQITVFPDGMPKKLPQTTLVDINGNAVLPDYAGKIVYESSVYFDHALPDVIDLGEVYECCELHLNGKFVGRKITLPYTFDISDHVKEGHNTICIEVINDFGHKVADPSVGFALHNVSVCSPLSPGGLLGPVAYCCCKR